MFNYFPLLVAGICVNGTRNLLGTICPRGHLCPRDKRISPHIPWPIIY